MTLVFAYEISYQNFATTEVTTIYVASEGFNTGPSDTPAHASFEGRISNKGSIRREISLGLKVDNEAKTSLGLIRAANGDGFWDFLIDTDNYGIDDRSFIIRAGDPDVDAYPADWVKIFGGTAESVILSFEEAAFRIRDNGAKLDQVVQKNKFKGTNVGVEGFEGTDGTIRGFPYPRCWGIVKNISPAPANTVNEIWTVNYDSSGAPTSVHDFRAVYNAGATYVDASTDVSTLNVLGSTAIATAQFKTALNEGAIKTGGAITGQITCDVQVGGSNAQNQAAAIAQALFYEAGFASTEVDATAITSYASSQTALIGIYVNTEGVTYRDVLTEIFKATCGWFGVSKDGRVTCAPLSLPSTVTPVVTFKRFAEEDAVEVNDYPIVSMTVGRDRRGAGGIPAARIITGYDRNYTVQTGEALAGSLTEERKAYLAEFERTVVSEASTVADNHPLAPELEESTIIVSTEAAEAFGEFKKKLYSRRRDPISIVTPFDVDLLNLIDIGEIVAVQVNRFGYTSGRNFVILGLDYDLENTQIVLQLWG